MDVQDQNKRKFERVPLDVDLYFRVNKPPEVRLKIQDIIKIGHALDISEGGMSFLLDAEVLKGTEVEINFNLIIGEIHNPKIEVKGEVRYCFPRDPEKSFRIGVQFTKIDANDKILIASYVKSNPLI